MATQTEKTRPRKQVGQPGLVERLGSGHTTGRTAPGVIVEMLREGLPVAELDDLQQALDVPASRLPGLLSISKATLQRRKAGQRLSQTESDRVVRFARLVGKAKEVFGSPDAARAWLKSPQAGLGGEIPLDYARTEVGAREVEDLLGRIDFGVYA